ncbi:DUF981 domain-containing protein [Aeromicrobium camelliae]|uniref:DUF981 domain-containing protein n=1 Tax=Aeromicrobium camelliae TaxID=1538144 RepID=A0A3N6X5X4_9ACTN|nr:DUF981 domain-containing protein [Aeromicrobium camelliae]RQN09068.1 DUF981 domain-containing protein [Aeromicrobium camelliae]
MSALAHEGLVIDWAQMPTYNTVMSVAVGAGLILLVWLGRELIRTPHEVVPEGWALAFGVLGFILTTTGLHMTLTWPLAAGGFPFDNIIFGETSLAFGVLLLAASLYVWFRGRTVLTAEGGLEHLRQVARPVSVFVLGMGLGLIGIAVAGVKYQLFAAPPEEPISGAFAEWPLVEAIFMSGLIALVGVGAVLFPFALRAVRSGLWKVIGCAWGITGVAFLLFGAMNFFTHIGLIVNTMG